MRFLTSGDFGFPFEWIFYFLKQFFLWSYQAGAANLDGVIRMPGRLVHLLVFMAFGNVAFDYFYLISSLIIAFVGFFYFAHKVLNATSLQARLLGSLFFALNPIFLGNLAKIGLILAAAMLPLSLAMVHQGFQKKQFRYFLLWLLCLNISLIHPFNFTVNVAVSGIYFLYLANQQRKFTFSNIPKFLGIGVLAILMNLYFLLPIASMRTLNKSVLSDTITSTPTDYTALVDVLNTGDVLTGLSLSRDVLLDFEFYDHNYMKVYFFGVFLFYILLFGMFVKYQKHLLEKDKQRSVLILIAFMTLVVLATVTVFNVGELIKILIQLPGGWTFRSPLKWQLYIPLTLGALLVILVEYVADKKSRTLISLGMVAAFILMNGYIATDIAHKLLTPRSITYFSELQQMKFNYDNMLFISGDRCAELQQENPRVMAEFNQILSSKYVQLKRISGNDLGLVNLSGYDYVMDCHGTMGAGTAARYDFARTNSFADANFELYQNIKTKPYMYPVTALTKLNPSDRLEDYYGFTTSTLGSDFDFVSSEQSVPQPTTSAQNLFENLNFENIKNGVLTVTTAPIQPGSQKLYVVPTGEPLYYQVDNELVVFSTTAQPGYTPLSQETDEIIDVEVPKDKKLSLTYEDASYQYQNLISNPSLEQGLWQKTVGDCYNYDDAPSIDMKLNKKDKSDGKQSLQLESANHIACTGPKDIPVEAAQTYLLSFDYQSPDRSGSYSLVFNDKARTSVQGRLLDNGEWDAYTRVVTVPKGATKAKLLFNAHPTSEGKGVAYYDNVRFAAIPDVGNGFYLVGEQTSQMKAPKKIEYSTVNPSKVTVKVASATTPFYLASSETYSDQWRLAPESTGANSWWPLAKVAAVNANDHLQINGTANAWYLDPQAICKDNDACTTNPDGSKNISLVLEYTPQRWFYLGAILSGIVMAGMISYIVYDFRRSRSKNGHFKSR